MSWFSDHASFEEKVDIHSHLLPGLDDGVRSYDEALEILTFFEDSGYEKVITTPHIYSEVYPNKSKTILERFELLQQKIEDVQMRIQVEVAAEYFVDEAFLHLIRQGDLLTIGGQ